MTWSTSEPIWFCEAATSARRSELRRPRERAAEAAPQDAGDALNV